MAEIVPESHPRVVSEAARLLLAGELVAYPTDTVYGLGALASDDNAVRRLFAAKARPPSKALPLLIADSLAAMEVADVSPLANRLMAQFWPGALTIVMRKHERFHSLALAKEDTVALRVPDHSLVRNIIRGVGGPITGTSANRSGGRSPVSAAEVAFQMGELVSLVIDGGPARGGMESTVLDISQQDGVKILRQGAVGKEEIEQVIGRPVVSG
jgi:L-threonylcarbamoyladenylate synthase